MKGFKMKITTELNKKAWIIRKAAASRFNCSVGEISWKECLEIANRPVIKKEDRVFKNIRGIFRTKTAKGEFIAQVGNFKVTGNKAYPIRNEIYHQIPFDRIPKKPYNFVFSGKPVWEI